MTWLLFDCHPMYVNHKLTITITKTTTIKTSTYGYTVNEVNEIIKK